jgi:putative two-component system response regulator
MQPSEPSIAAFAHLLPYQGATDIPERLASLATELRKTPTTDAGRPIFELASDALSGMPDPPASADLAMCLLLITRFRSHNGEAFAGLEPATRAAEIAEHVGDPLLLTKALKMLGVICIETGDYPGAVGAFGRGLESAKLAGDAVQEAEIFSNLGLAHQYAGHFSEAVPCYERAAEIAESARDSDSGQYLRSAAALALANLSLACRYLKDYGRGLDAAERAAELLAQPADNYARGLRAGVECYYTWLLLEVKNVGSARERAKLARLYGSGAGEQAELFADMAQGLVEVHDTATRDLGLSRLQRAVNQSRKGAATTLRDALATIVRGYEVAGQPNSALVYLHEIVQLNRDNRVGSVLRHHRMHLERIGRDLDGVAQAALHQQQEDLRFKRLSMDVLRECMQVLEKNTVAAELHDDETGEHCYRVGALSKELARARGMDAEMCTLIDLSARLHDIGKLRVPDSILLKPGKFTPEERTIMQAHCAHGWELIGEGGLAQLFVAQEIALNHHERWDGRGYPNGRQGSMIPLAARVTALADVFDALTHRRCYKEAWTVKDALQEIASLGGKHFDPELTDIFLKLVPSLQAQHGDLDAYLGAEARRSDFIKDRERVAREVKSDLGTFDMRR